MTTVVKFEQMLSNRVVLILAGIFITFAGCTDFRHTIYGKYGTISSPNYPMKYPLNTTVVWFIIVERSKTIQLNFTSFSLEKNKKCLYDHVYIEETKIGAASISRKYCGHHIPPSYKSLSHKIKVVFESDPLSHVDYGFKAMWMEVGDTNTATFPTEPVINPTKSCIPTTITVVEPCQQKVPRTVTVTVTSKPSTCICATRTLTQTVTQTKTITKSASLRISVTKSSPTPTVKKTVSRSRDDDNLNRVEDPKGCKALPPSSLIDSEKAAAEKQSSKSLIVSLGVVLAALFITNIFLLVLLCKRDRGTRSISFYSLRRLINSKRKGTSNAPDIYYSSYTRPTLRMVNGEIVVVPKEPGTLTTESDATSSVQLGTNKRERLKSEPVYIDRIDESNESAFHIIPQEQAVCTLGSGGTDENTIASTRSEVLSDSEPTQDRY